MPTKPRYRLCAKIRGRGGRTCWPATSTNWTRMRSRLRPMARVYAVSWKPRCYRGSRTVRPNLRATPGDTEQDLRDMEDDEAMTQRAVALLSSRRNDTYEAALSALREVTRARGAGLLAR